MCGRFTLNCAPEDLASTFHINKPPDLEAQYNIAPTQRVVAILYNLESQQRELVKLRWGLIPSWAKDMGISAKLINARAETVAQKPAFRSAFKYRRCLVVADGFYEWQRQGGKKQPYYFRLSHGQPFAFAGLWEKWMSPQAEQISSCTILTTEANEIVKPVHGRMPVIIDTKNYDLWLNPEVQTTELLQPLLVSYPDAEMTAYPVSSLVNNSRHNLQECIVPLSDNLQ
ncbi:MAG: SOS response-associated peptidase [Calothrix sp. MO_192.B10]|nr:SOS response-associated peptidase [Calothrix sp. MO_192.B10]